jgi:hypothetical protein
MGKNGQKWAKMGKNGQKWAKMGKNGRKPCAPTVNLKLKKQLKIKI